MLCTVTWKDRKEAFERWLKLASSKKKKDQAQVDAAIKQLTGRWEWEYWALTRNQPFTKAVLLANNLPYRATEDHQEYFPPDTPLNRQFVHRVQCWWSSGFGGPNILVTVTYWIRTWQQRAAKKGFDADQNTAMIEAFISMLEEHEAGRPDNNKLDLPPLLTSLSIIQQLSVLDDHRRILSDVLCTLPEDPRVRVVMQGFYDQMLGREFLVAFHHKYGLQRPYWHRGLSVQSRF